MADPRQDQDYRKFAQEQIHAITDTLTHVMFGDFTQVARTTEPDESFGYLCIMVNVAINAARNAQAKLQKLNDQLESLVDTRTKELKETNRKLRAEIVEREQIEKSNEVLHKRLQQVAHQAGMSEVATGVLHNVGNALNGVNVSTSLIADRVRSLEVSSLAKAMQILQDHKRDLATFLEEDATGRKILDLLTALGGHFTRAQQSLIAEAGSLVTKIEHIKRIVDQQQAYARGTRFEEIVSIPDLLDDALKICSMSLQRHGIRIDRREESFPDLVVDRHRLISVLVNLIGNAKHSLLSSKRTDRRIVVRSKLLVDDRLRIAVADNGVGIPKVNLKKIFHFGFTTRNEGHGFGLHTSAMAAKELGGNLEARNNGADPGATFTLELPVKRAGTLLQGRSA